MNGYKASARVQNTNAKVFTFDANIKLPDSIDWRTKGYVTPIKDEGQCSASWAFSTTGAIEGQHFAQTGQLVSLSEQNLIDCSQKQGTMGCNGGLMDQAFTYVLENNGIDTESSYPATGIPGPCRFSPRDVGANITGYVDIKSKDESALQQAVGTVGPVSVAIDASHSSFQLYKRGIYNEHACSQTQLDHGVLAVGYGAEGSSDYWLVKNSWGTSWGQEGYIQMTRNKKNQCGIATAASYPTV